MKEVEKDEEPDLVFFDGDCALCQRSVLFLLRRDPQGRRFRFGSQQGETFERTVPLGARAAFAGSLVVVTPRQRVEIRSGAVVRLLHRLGGGWSVLAGVYCGSGEVEAQEVSYQWVTRLSVSYPRGVV